jgi:hypothetical protein
MAFAVVLALCIGLAWWLAGDIAGPKPVASSPTVAAVPKATQANAAPTPTPPPPAAVTPAAPEATPSRPMTPLEAQEAKQLEEADYRIGNIILTEKTVEATRDKLLLLFPSFSKAEKIKAAPHLVNLVDDENLPRLLPFLMNPLTPTDAQETIFNDMLNRPPQTGWPVLIDVIAQPKHPLATRAKELLTTIVGGDHGDNVAAWQQALRDQLVLQGVEPTAANPAQAGAAPQVGGGAPM